MITNIVIKGYRIFSDFQAELLRGTNIIVGDNASGKSTLLEAITLVLTGRIGGRWAGEDLSPYWFNTRECAEFFAARRAGNAATSPPRILIEAYLSDDDDILQPLRGVNNSARRDCPGLRLTIGPAEEYLEELEAYLTSPDFPDILPIEYYEVDWRSFAGDRILRRPKGLAVAAIDSRTIRSTAGVDYHTRSMMSDYIEQAERTSIAIAHRVSRHAISSGALVPVNDRIAAEGSVLYDEAVALHMDQSASAGWENDLVPHVDNVPFAMAGQGRQAAIKVALAMHRSTDKTAFVLVEEPENHMSHTSLTKLIGKITELAADRQVFVTTHSSFVLNRLGLSSLMLLRSGLRANFNQLSTETVKYFQKLPGYDTLRLVLADKVVLTEGPSDEIVLERAFLDRFGGLPMTKGVDVISMRGVAFRRGLELSAALNRKTAAVRDNDGKEPEHWTRPLNDFLQPGFRQVFIGDPSQGHTLEPQILRANSEDVLRDVLDLPDSTDIGDWMSSNKTEAALKIASAEVSITWPAYINDTVDFLA